MTGPCQFPPPRFADGRRRKRDHGARSRAREWAAFQAAWKGPIDELLKRQLLLQTSAAASGLVVRELVRQVRHAISLALLNGSGGSGQPQGIIGTTGVGNQSGTSLAWAGIIEMMRLVEATGPLTATRGRLSPGSCSGQVDADS